MCVCELSHQRRRRRRAAARETSIGRFCVCVLLGAPSQRARVRRCCVSYYTQSTIHADAAAVAAGFAVAAAAAAAAKTIESCASGARSHRGAKCTTLLATCDGYMIDWRAQLRGRRRNSARARVCALYACAQVAAGECTRAH